MGDILINYWLQWLCGLGAAGLTAGFRILYQRQKKTDLRQQATEHGIQALLRDRIV